MVESVNQAEPTVDVSDQRIFLRPSVRAIHSAHSWQHLRHPSSAFPNIYKGNCCPEAGKKTRRRGSHGILIPAARYQTPVTGFAAPFRFFSIKHDTAPSDRDNRGTFWLVYTGCPVNSSTRTERHDRDRSKCLFLIRVLARLCVIRSDEMWLGGYGFDCQSVEWDLHGLRSEFEWIMAIILLRCIG